MKIVSTAQGCRVIDEDDQEVVSLPDQLDVRLIGLPRDMRRRLNAFDGEIKATFCERSLPGGFPEHELDAFRVRNLFFSLGELQGVRIEFL